ncbi:MAG TPA: hypothetical protein VGE24_14025 [Emticicia sp.]
MTLKNYFFIFLLSIILASCLRNQSAKFSNPPNTKPLVNGKFLDVSYIECLHVLEFLYCLQQDPNSQELYKRIKPKTDSLVFGQYILNYTDYRFRFYPMPVSKELAIEYCKWRGAVVTHLKNFGEKRPHTLYSEIIRQNKEAKFIIKYSIPTAGELQIPYKYKTEFRNYDTRFMTYEVLNHESTDTTKLYLLRCIATIER